jgi:four helix bundle protein
LTITDFKKLKVWQIGFEIAEKCYLCTEEFPKSEQFGLSNQIRRCAVSISSNIAEGCGRSSGKEFCQFLSIATGSCFELETQLLLSGKLKFGRKELLTDIITTLSVERKMLIQFRKKGLINNCDPKHA